MKREGTQSITPTVQERSYHLLNLSARSMNAVRQAALNLSEHLDMEPDQSLGDLAYTLHVGRRTYDHRLTLTAQSREELQQLCLQAGADEWLDMQKEGSIQYGKRARKKHKIAFLFSGQGSHYTDMGRELYETSSVFKRVYDECFEAVTDYFPVHFSEYMFNEAYKANLDTIAVSSVAMFTIEYALAQLWISWGIKPDIVYGHSLGEYVAACVAGTFSYRDALVMLAKRGRLAEEGTEPGGLLWMNSTFDTLTEYMRPYGDDLSIATVNSPTQYVLAGRKKAIHSLMAQLEQDEVVHRLLPIHWAFHSVLMEPVIGQYRAFMNQEATFHPLQIPLVSNLSGQVVLGEPLDAEYWCRHMLETVQFAAGYETLVEQGITTFIELGPRPVLKALVESMGLQEDQLLVASLSRKEPDWKMIQESLGQLWVAGVEVDWKQFDQDYSRRRVHAPTYPFELQSCWVEVDAYQSPYARELAAQNSTADVAEFAEPEQASAARVQRTPEEWVRAIWKEVLGVTEIDWEDNFLHLGGESLNLIQVQSRLNKVFKLNIQLRDLHAHTEFGELVTYIKSQLPEEDVQEKSAEPVAPVNELIIGEVPLSPVQKWIFETKGMNPEFFFLPIALETNKKVDAQRLKQALHSLHQHHDMLRAVYQIDGAEVKQILLAPDDVQIEVHEYDLSMYEDDQEREAAYDRLQFEFAYSITFDKGLMNRAALFKLDENIYRVLWLVSHLYSDTVSNSILPHDLIAAYERLEQGQPVALGDKTTSYREWVQSARSFINTPDGAEAFDYWNEVLKKIENYSIPVDHAEGSNTIADIRPLKLTLDVERTAKLRKTAPAIYKCTMKDVLFAIVSRTLAKWFEQEQVLFAINGHGRDVFSEDFSMDLSRTVGYFVNTYPFCAEITAEQTIAESIKQIEQQVANMPHGGVSFNMLRFLSEDPYVRDRFRTYQMPEVLLNYHGEISNIAETSGEWQRARAGVLEQPPGSELQFKIIILSGIRDGKLSVHFTYSEQQYELESIERLEHLFEQEVQQMLEESEALLSAR